MRKQCSDVLGCHARVLTKFIHSNIHTHNHPHIYFKFMAFLRFCASMCGKYKGNYVDEKNPTS